MSTEPKIIEAFIEMPMCGNLASGIRTDVIRADDPALDEIKYKAELYELLLLESTGQDTTDKIAEWKRESEEVTKLKELLSVKMLNEVFVWKRESEAMDKLVSLAKEWSSLTLVCEEGTVGNPDRWTIYRDYLLMVRATAPDLVTAIEQVKEGV